MTGPAHQVWARIARRVVRWATRRVEGVTVRVVRARRRAEIREQRRLFENGR